MIDTFEVTVHYEDGAVETKAYPCRNYARLNALTLSDTFVVSVYDPRVESGAVLSPELGYERNRDAAFRGLPLYLGCFCDNCSDDAWEMD